MAERWGEAMGARARDDEAWIERAPADPRGNGRVEQVARIASAFLANVNQVIVGKPAVAELVLVALLAEGHVLLEDVPGMGKTMLARAAAASLGCEFRRIQCTPDLLPSDVTGVQYFDQRSGSFSFRPGPLMSNLVLVDEINRATPRTQSALLEAMQERQVTVDVETLPLPNPFLVMATQNPVELEGTFPLPEAQLDRFLLRLRVGYPDAEEEGEILARYREDDPLSGLMPVTTAAQLTELQGFCREVFVSTAVREYVVALSRATRDHVDVKLGASPRASLALQRAGQALAAVRGRGFVLPDDVKYVAVPVLAHRLTLHTEARLRGRTAEQVVEELLRSVAVPVEG